MFFDNFDLSKNTSLYIHIPFCKSKCYYCAFYSKVAKQKEIAAYVNKLILELKQAVEYFKKPFYTVFLGGGNPGLLSEEQLIRICKVVTTYGKPKEFTMEINPENLKENYLELFDYVNRLSVGIQSLNEGRLKKLGRNSSLLETKTGLKTAFKLREKYSIKLNLDFICCVDKDSNATIKDLEEIFSYGKPEHLSVYELTLEEGTILYKQDFEGLNEEETVIELQAIWAFMKAEGFDHYEVSAFASKTNYCLHNLVYWNMEQYLGLGTAAASTALKKYSRIEGKKNIKNYLESEPLSIYKVTELNEREKLEEWVIMNLRKKSGIDLEILEDRFKVNLNNFTYPGYETKDNKFKIGSEKGFLLCDGCAYSLLEHLTEI